MYNNVQNSSLHYDLFSNLTDKNRLDRENVEKRVRTVCYFRRGKFDRFFDSIKCRLDNYTINKVVLVIS